MKYPLRAQKREFGVQLHTHFHMFAYRDYHHLTVRAISAVSASARRRADVMAKCAECKQNAVLLIMLSKRSARRQHINQT